MPERYGKTITVTGWPTGYADEYRRCQRVVADLMRYPLTKGNRVRIREGYDGAGDVWFYVGKDAEDVGMVLVTSESEELHFFLAAAIEPYPYTREERIERAIEDYVTALDDAWPAETGPHGRDALLFAIIDAGV